MVGVLSNPASSGVTCESLAVLLVTDILGYKRINVKYSRVAIDPSIRSTISTSQYLSIPMLGTIARVESRCPSAGLPT